MICHICLLANVEEHLLQATAVQTEAVVLQLVLAALQCITHFEETATGRYILY